MYYAIIIDDKLDGIGECPCSGDNTFSVVISEEMYNNIDHYMWNGSNVVLKRNYEQEESEKEQERVNKLTMTALDFVTFLEQINIPYSEIQNYLAQNPNLDKQLKYCQNVYCGVVKQIVPITVAGVTITSEMVEQAFKTKNGEL